MNYPTEHVTYYSTLISNLYFYSLLKKALIQKAKAPLNQYYKISYIIISPLVITHTKVLWGAKLKLHYNALSHI